MGLLVTGHVALLALEARGDSATWDEVGHLAAGLENWRHGTFRIYSVNPPLAHLVAAAPVALLAPDLDPTAYGLPDGPGARPEFTVGSFLARQAGLAYFPLLASARWMCIPFSLLGALICYRWSAELFGTHAGLLALALWCLSPTILAYGHLITPDMAAAGCGVAAAYLLRGWLHAPTWGRAAGAGALLGLAELTKSTWFVLFALWPITWIVYRLVERPTQLRRKLVGQAAQMGGILFLALWILNAGYGFEGSFERLGDFRFVSVTLRGTDRDEVAPGGMHVGNRFARGPLRDVRVPLPENYVLGIDFIKMEYERKYWSYLRGKWRFGGWWYYYLYAMLVKEPLGTWGLALLAAGAVVVCHRTYGAPAQEELLLLLPLIVVLVLVSSQTGFNHHLRYVLPIYPFAFILIARVGRAFEGRHRGAASGGGSGRLRNARVVNDEQRVGAATQHGIFQ